MSTKLKVHITISLSYLRNCLSSRAFVLLAASYNIVVKVPADHEKYKIVISCPPGHDQEAAEIRRVVESALIRPIDGHTIDADENFHPGILNH